jgi:hypothetical protein
VRPARPARRPARRRHRPHPPRAPPAAGVPARHARARPRPELDPQQRPPALLPAGPGPRRRRPHPRRPPRPAQLADRRAPARPAHACGALPGTDRRILLSGQWHLRQLAAVPDPGHQRLLRQYATWDQLARLHAAARAGKLATGARNRAAEQFTSATRFLSWLAARRRHLDGTTQAGTGDWHVNCPRHHGKLRGFLTRAITTRRAPAPGIPAQPRATTEPITQDRRIAALRHVLTDDTEPLRTRVAACLVLPCAQPVSRLTRLTTDDITRDGDQALLRFGDPPTTVPEPSALLTQLAASRANMNTAASPAARWLFPGGRPGQPLTPGALLPSLRRLGIPAAQARTSALRELVTQAPAPVIAQALGYSHATTRKHLADAGGTWNRYPPLRRDQ